MTVKVNISCLRKLETKSITLLQPDYNILPQASNLNHKLSLETRARISAAKSTPEARARISAARKGVVASRTLMSQCTINSD